MKCAIFKAAFGVALALNVLIGCGGGSDDAPAPMPSQPDPPSSPGADDPQIVRTDYLLNLDRPWDLAFAPDGSMFFTERCDGLSVRRTDGSIRRLFGISGYALVAADFFCDGQSGMNGVAIDPEFNSNRFVYVYMSSSLAGTSNRVVRLTVNNDYTGVSLRTDIVTDIAFKTAANRWGSRGLHSGGRIRFSPVDGYLYVTTGDNHNGPLPQDLTRLGGKVLRIDRYGAAAVSNNTPTGGDARIFTYGHRNVQGIAFRPTSGQPFSCEHGPGHSDEVTPLIAGGNGGWDPRPQTGVTCDDNYCGYVSNRPDGQPTRMTDTDRYPNALPASWNNEGDSAGMGPCTFLNGAQWGAWNGRLAVGIMGANRLEILQLDTNGMTTAHQVVAGLPAARMRSVVQGPDGALYVAIDAGQIWRLSPQ